MDVLNGVIRHYDWGSTAAIPGLLGRVPDGRPWAELWLGANHSAPSLVGSRARPLDEEIGADPAANLGWEVEKRFGQLPFLLKVLSAAEPLSIQAHPSHSQAEAGFERENSAGISLDAPNRSFRDRNHKPELICALTRFESLCGFRDPRHTVRLLAAIDASHLDPLKMTLEGDERGAIERAVRWIFSIPNGDIEATIGDLKNACLGGVDDEFAGEAQFLADLVDRYPADVGVILSLLLNYVTLLPGEAVFLDSGILHSYLRGTGIELMANSDNVLRGGLTNKHVDVAGLLDVVSMETTNPVIQRVDHRSPATRYRSPVGEFSLTRISLDGDFELDRGPAILICVDGRADIGSHLLERGSAVWLPASDGRVTVDGRATLFQAAVGEIG